MKAIFIILAILMVSQAFKMTSKVNSKNMSKNTSMFKTKVSYGCPNNPTTEECALSMQNQFLALCQDNIDLETYLYPSLEHCENDAEYVEYTFENACYCDPDEDWAAGYRNLCYYAITQGLPSCIPIP